MLFVKSEIENASVVHESLFLLGFIFMMSLSLEKQIYCFNDHRKRDLGSTRIGSLFSLLVSIKEQHEKEH